MSWSEDTRCLYCEGRLPLYRKITHGQFCSSAHRKAYWQEHERLAVERLHQTHSSLRSYRSLEVPPEVSQESVPYPDLESVTQARVATYSEVETDLELDPAPSFDVNLYPIPDTGEPPVPASELLSLLAPDFLALGGGSPELVASDPFEYEITRQPLPPAWVWSRPGTNPLPEAPRMAVWSYLGPQASELKKAAGASSVTRDSEVEFCHPRSGQPTAGMRAAGCVGLPHSVALEARRAAAASASSLQVLEMAATPVTSVELDVPLQSDVLLQLLDQQMPQPDRLHALEAFSAHPSDWAFASLPPQQFDTAAKTALPTAAPVTADCQPATSTDMLQLSAALLPAQGTRVSRTAISEIAIHPQTVTSAILPVAESIHQVDMAGLQSLRSNLSRPAQTVLARRATASLAFDLGTGVSSDVTYPSLAPVVADVEARRHPTALA